MSTKGQWHGNEYYFGLHYDLHAGRRDTSLGTHCTIEELTAALKDMSPDYVQTDCKGHPGMTSWFSKVPAATVSPGVKKDALEGWRAATRGLGMPLHCHYSGIWDQAAAEKFPNWTVLHSPSMRRKAKAQRSDKMCPRSPYLNELLIPQLLELIDRYGVDGFWMDGEIWAVEPCYCRKCRKAFTERTGIETPPEDTSHPDWLSWIRFQRDSFEEYVTAYCDAVHSHKPGVLVCSNWMQTFKNPGEPKVPTDWISGDNTWVFGLDGSRCEARFISTRGKPWDIMLWSFYRSGNMRDPASPWCVKPVQMLQQEAAVTLALGGNLQIYENPGKVRDGRLASWRMKRLGQVGDFVRARQSLCQGSETIPQVAILHSETHFYSQSVGNLRNGHDALPVEGAVFSLLENSFGVDILDEWALLPKLQEFPMVVVPEQHNLSDRAVRKLKEYVKQGGRLLVTGAMTYERFGARFLGARSVRVEEGSSYHVAAGAGAFPFFSEHWRLLKTAAARELSRIMPHDLLDGEVCPHPAAVLNKVGKGSVAYVPADLFRYFRVNRYPFAREFIGELAAELSPKLNVRVEAPPCVDAILRRKDGKTIIHLINRLSGIPNQPGNGAVDEIPPAGPVKVVINVSGRPGKVSVAFERGNPTWQCKPIRRGSRSATLTAVVKKVHIHSALVVE